MAFLVWNDNFMTGVETIDRQHMALVDIINELYAFAHESKDKTEEQHFRALILRLEDYSHYHFSEEEKILKEKNSPDISFQKRQHQFFRSEIIRIKKDISEGRSVSPESLLSFSKTWLTEHILNVDKKIGDLNR